MYLIILCELRIKFMLSLRYEQKREIKKKNPLSLKVIFVTFKQSPCCNIWRKTYCIIIRITIHTVNMSVFYVTSQRRLMGKLFRGYCYMPPSHIIQHNLYWHTPASYNVDSPSRHCVFQCLSSHHMTQQRHLFVCSSLICFILTSHFQAVIISLFSCPWYSNHSHQNLYPHCLQVLHTF